MHRRKASINRVKPMPSDHETALRFGPCLVGLAWLMSGDPGAARVQDPTSLCDQAALMAAENHAVPAQIMLAITRVETGRRDGSQVNPWPWAINLDGKSYWFDDIDLAMAFADQQLAIGVENFDVGCFQINLRWHGAKFSSLADVFDPQTNADYAAQFLSNLYAANGSWDLAVAAYHSRTPDVAAVYVQKVQDALADLQLSDDNMASITVAAPAHPNRFPLLQAGVSAGAGSLVPMIEAATPFIGVFP